MLVFQIVSVSSSINSSILEEVFCGPEVVGDLFLYIEDHFKQVEEILSIAWDAGVILEEVPYEDRCEFYIPNERDVEETLLEEFLEDIQAIEWGGGYFALYPVTTLESNLFGILIQEL
jgi:hypothetical protein